MIVMLVIIPLICLITSVFYGIRNGFNFWYILIVAIMFAPSIFIFYNSSAWVYVVGYAVIALLGNLIALPLRKDNFQFAALVPGRVWGHARPNKKLLNGALPQAVAESSNENMRAAAIICFMDTFSAIIMVV